MHHRQSIELWLRRDLFAIYLRGFSSCEVLLNVLASATLVDFPQFRDIHHLIPQILNNTLSDTEKQDYHQIEDSDNWEIYVNYRQIVSRFLIGHWQTCEIPRDTHDDTAGAFLFSLWSRRGQENYVNLAKYLLRFLDGVYL